MLYRIPAKNNSKQDFRADALNSFLLFPTVDDILHDHKCCEVQYSGVIYVLLVFPFYGLVSGLIEEVDELTSVVTKRNVDQLECPSYTLA